jgi:hypothetical protein
MNEALIGKAEQSGDASSKRERKRRSTLTPPSG